MVAYSFKPRFEAPIVDGSKAQTIRADRRRHARPGETLQLYTGMRTKSCRLIGLATCRAVVPIRIDLEGGRIESDRGTNMSTVEELDYFAQRDGFSGWSDMLDFWRREHPRAAVWSGMLILWSSFRRGAP